MFRIHQHVVLPQSLTLKSSGLGLALSGAINVTGGPFSHTKYELRQVHFHWGERDDFGSEHTVKGCSFAMEVHFVHWNTDLYSSYEEAASEDGGLVIVAAFANLDSRGNPAIEHICNYASAVRYKRQWEKISVDIKQLLPNNIKKYWVYKGSMTVPPCYESVTWVIFNDNITVSSRQLAQLRTLHNHSPNDRPPADECQGYITKNLRNLQPTGTRRVTAVEHVFTIGQIVQYASLYDGSSVFTTSKDFTWTGGLQGSDEADF
ncbi:hypothetical protein LSH36_32g15026 [Paralvinella palmiformis]|uniref:Carbonic anhydrase n=1 Tax=Paralvinella palmiformis TaxID=53620 RepID=A0AAD9NEA1_9ANNE|nr:hypothetical protein LSH36_32g15026 [Paralvinella palmiformis]